MNQAQTIQTAKPHPYIILGDPIDGLTGLDHAALRAIYYEAAPIAITHPLECLCEPCIRAMNSDQEMMRFVYAWCDRQPPKGASRVLTIEVGAGCEKCGSRERVTLMDDMNAGHCQNCGADWTTGPVITREGIEATAKEVDLVWFLENVLCPLESRTPEEQQLITEQREADEKWRAEEPAREAMYAFMNAKLLAHGRIAKEVA